MGVMAVPAAVGGFVAGMLFAFALVAFREWRKTVAAVPKTRAASFAASRRLVLPGLIVLAVLYAALHG